MLDILIKGYDNPKITSELILEYIKDNKVEFPVLSHISLLYNNTEDIIYFTTLCGNLIYKDKDLTMLEEYINMGIYLKRQGCNKEFIAKYLKYSYEDVNIENIFKYLEELNYLEDYYHPFINKLRETHFEEFKKIMEHKEFFDKKEIVKWIATNNRKTKEFYTDYGVETNDLIKFIHSKTFIDNNCQKNIKLLGINSFKDYVENANMFALRAMLSSIIRRERFGVGSISRSIADGLISDILERMSKIITLQSL